MFQVPRLLPDAHTRPRSTRMSPQSFVLLALLVLPACNAERASAPEDRSAATEQTTSPLEFEGGSEIADLSDLEETEAPTTQGTSNLFREPAGELRAAPLPQHAPVESMAPAVATGMETESSISEPMAVADDDGFAASSPTESAPSRTPKTAKHAASVNATPKSSGPFAKLPAGATHDAAKGFATIQVFYATDRAKASGNLGEYSMSGNRDAFVLLGGFALAFFGLAVIQFWRKRHPSALAFCAFGSVSAVSATMLLLSGGANIEKHGVTYSGDRGSLVKGICEVTVPDTHDRGVVERPTLLRFEVKEKQRDHIVLTSAIELSEFDFHRRLRETVGESPDQDLLVFIHGYNVDFESAVRRTAQISVDLPFEGVPVCYSWPSQGSLFGYTVDETNASWTQAHLKQFLLDLAGESGAESIHVVAHSMGNRPTTGALSDIAVARRNEKLFDRVVLAAPDVDADQFRRDLAPDLGQIANHVTLYASSDDQALVVSKQVHGYPRAGESGEHLVVVPGIETVDVTGIDLSLLGHSYYGDSASMLQDLYQLVRHRLPAVERRRLETRNRGELTYWQLVQPRTRVGAGSQDRR